MEMDTWTPKLVRNVTMGISKILTVAHIYARLRKDTNAYKGICILLANARINVEMGSLN